MNIKDKARDFALKAHMGQVRKGEKDKPMIMHPFSVAKILEEYNYDDNLIASGYLHDVVEDTKYTNEDIKKEFGSDIDDLVKGASEPDKSLSWEERKKHTIEFTKTLPLRNKLLICADKISNLEDLLIIFERNSKRDFSSFKKGEKEQKWYYTNVYESLIYNEDKELPIFKRLKNVIDILFNNKQNEYLNNIFKDNIDYYNELKKLHYMKLEIYKLKQLCSLNKPYIIEFCGTPRTGKTSTINNLYDFFKKGKFKTKIIEEFTTSKYYKEEFKIKNKDLSHKDRNILIIEETKKQLESELNDSEILLVDRSINDRQIWNYIRYKNNDIDEKSYRELKDKYKNISKELIDTLVITTSDAFISLKRDYYNSLALEERTFLNIDNINEYNDSVKSLENLFKESVDNLIIIDTSYLNMNEVAIEITKKILISMRKKYISTFKEKYNIKEV